MTLGEKLKKIRSEYRISLNEVSKHTKIQMKYLEYLENSEYEKLPAEVYVRGFVRSYANFLGTDEEILVKMYERERNIQKNLKKEQFQDKKENTFTFPRFIVTPKLFVVGGIMTLALSGFIYLYREFQSFASVPRLVILEPSDGGIIHGSDVFVRGTTEKDATLMINGQPVLVRDGGDFYERVPLQPGLNTFTVVSANKFKKEKSIVLSVRADYEAPVAAQEGVESLSTGIVTVLKTKFEIYSQEKPLTLKVEADGVTAYNGVLSPGAVQMFEVSDRLRVSSEDGSKTFIRIGNSAESKPISTVSGEAKDVIFMPEGSESAME